MTTRRPLTALVLSAIIAGGTLFVVDKRNDEAERTVNDIQQRSLEYQREMTKSMTDGAPSAGQVEQAAQAQIDAVKAQVEAAK